MQMFKYDNINSIIIMAYSESQDIRTGKAPKHQKAAKGRPGKDISNTEIVPSKKPINKIRKSPKHDFLLYNALFNYCRDRLSIDDDAIIELRIRKATTSDSSRTSAGGINLSLDRNLINVDEGSPDLTMKRIIHEFTHLKQKLNGELKIEGGTILWKNKPFITMNKYRRIAAKQSKEYLEMPWEIEAYKNMNLISDFYGSSYFTDLKGQNKKLDYIMNPEQGLYETPEPIIKSLFG